MFPTVILAPNKEQVLSLLASGKTVAEAAEAVGVHRNTINNWRRSSPVFRQRWESMQYEKAMHFREQMQSLVPLAMDTLRQIMQDPKAPATARLKAALEVMKQATALAPAQPEFPDLKTQAAAKANTESFLAHQTAELKSYLSDIRLSDVQQPEKSVHDAQACTTGPEVPSNEEEIAKPNAQPRTTYDTKPADMSREEWFNILAERWADGLDERLARMQEELEQELALEDEEKTKAA
jgi:hypothetical protein